MNHTILVLDRPGNTQETAARHDGSAPLEDRWLKNDVGDAGFVLYREKYEAFGSTGPLSGDHASGDANEPISGRIVGIDAENFAYCP